METSARTVRSVVDAWHHDGELDGQDLPKRKYLLAADPDDLDVLVVAIEAKLKWMIRGMRRFGCC